MRMDVYLYLSSADSPVIHRDNTPLDFTTELPQPIELKGSWECALLDFQLTGVSPPFDPSFDPICVCSDICHESCVGDVQLPILRRLSFKGRKKESVFRLEHPPYVRVTRDQLTRIRLFITNPTQTAPAVTTGKLTCTLHLRSRQ
jgi:hypothetical protein